MNTDLPQRLRALYVQNGTPYVQQAADLIERQAQEVERLTPKRTADNESLLRLSDQVDRLWVILDAARDERDALLVERDALRYEVRKLAEKLAELREAFEASRGKSA